MYETAEHIVERSVEQWNQGLPRWWKENGLTLADYLSNMAVTYERNLDYVMNNYRAEEEHKAKQYRKAADLVRQAGM